MARFNRLPDRLLTLQLRHRLDLEDASVSASLVSEHVEHLVSVHLAGEDLSINMLLDKVLSTSMEVLRHLQLVVAFAVEYLERMQWGQCLIIMLLPFYYLVVNGAQVGHYLC